MLLTEHGTWQRGQDFTPWGAVRSGRMPETSLSFTGQRQDESGLLYYHARFYDPELGRFLSADTVVPAVGALTVAPSDKTAAPLFDQGGKGSGSETPQALNRYAYANNNPLRYTDPTGHYIESALDIAGIAYDAYDMYNNGLNWTNGLSMAGNIAGLLLPGVTGVGAGVRLAAKSAQAASKARQATTVGRAARAVGRVAATVCSFSAETVVATKDGPKAISAVQNGDQVLAYDAALGTTGSYTVTEVFVHTDPIVTYLTIAGEVIDTTPEHPFYTEKQGWTSAAELWVGAHVRKLDGTSGTVEAIEFVAQPQPMYNLSVAEAHTFFVGDEQWLVHNNCRFRFPNVRFKGLIRNTSLKDLRWDQVEQTLTGIGLQPSRHFMERLMKDPRTARYGINTLADLEKFFYKGVTANADNGAKALIHGRMAVIFNPETGMLMTIRPWGE